MASKIGIIIEREYTTRVVKWSFILLTLLAPIFFVVLSSLPAILMAVGGGDEQKVAIIDRTGLYHGLWQDTEQYQFVVADRTMDDYRTEGENDEFTAFLEIRQDLNEDPKAATLYSYNTLPPGLEDYINKTLSSYLSDQRLSTHDIPNIKEIIRESKVDTRVATFRIGEDGSEAAVSSEMSVAIAFVLAITSYMFISIYGGMVVRGVTEEKKSRVMEVIISSVKPFDLMMGKIIGIGLVGLTQLAIWVMLTVGLYFGAQFLFLGDMYSEAALAAAQQSGQISAMDASVYAEVFAPLSNINFTELIILFVLYFIGGYLLYASIFAALGSAASSEEDSGQIMMPITMILLASFYIGFACINDPEGALATWCSYIPFTSPMVMLARLPFGVALWEELLSLAILYGSFFALTVVAGKIYRIGVLMYGKKPSFKEIWRWLRYY